MADELDIPEGFPLAELSPARVNTISPVNESDIPRSAAPARDSDVAKEHNSMLDIHPSPHAPSSWKEFLIHIATIVLGLLIAIGLEQAVEHLHNRHEVTKVREELQGERETNKRSFTSETTHWRWETVELENNLMVLAYLQKHPGTPDQELPGSLVWFHDSTGHSHAVWDAAKSGGVTSLMSREEVEQYEGTYNQLERIDVARSLTWDAMNDASRYELTDGRLSNLSATQIAEIANLTQIALTKHWLEGVLLENTARCSRISRLRSPPMNSLKSATGKVSLRQCRIDPSP